MNNINKKILLTGATGYVGGRLLKALEKQNDKIHCLARRPEYLKSRVDKSTVIFEGDVLDPESLPPAFEGVKIAYYMIHSMGTSGSFEENDRLAAKNFADMAKAEEVERIIYLGGLGDEDESLSAHLRSRQEVGHILRESGIPVIELRASIVIGSGSLSFEMIRSLVERLPVMIIPRWVSMSAQPIAIEDLIAYLIEAKSVKISGHQIFEIGGADQVSYAEIMRIYAKCRNMRIRMIRVPVLTPHLSSLWLGLITPLYARIGKKLIESIVHSTVVHDDTALKVFDIRPMGIENAIKRALANEDRAYAATRWSDALSSAGKVSTWMGVRFGARIVDSRTIEVKQPPSVAFKPIQQIGGDTGWYAWNSLWRIRGFLDLLIGGVGLRRGRRNPEKLKVGEPIDFWRVEQIEPDQKLRLFAEMKLPGRAWLEFEVTGNNSSSTIRQTAIFDPVGLSGRLYWYVLYLVHQLVFSGMLRGIADAARKDN